MVPDNLVASRREFFLYWAGVLILAFSVTSILMSTSELLIDTLSYRCWYPILSPLLGVSEPRQDMIMPVYCANPAVAIVRFMFSFLSELIFVGVGTYMIMSGRRR